MGICHLGVNMHTLNFDYKLCLIGLSDKNPFLGEHIFNGHAHGEVQMFKLSEPRPRPRLNDEKN